MNYLPVVSAVNVRVLLRIHRVSLKKKMLNATKFRLAFIGVFFVIIVAAAAAVTPVVTERHHDEPPYDFGPKMGNILGNILLL